MEIVFIILGVLVVLTFVFVVMKRRTKQNDVIGQELSVTNSNQLSISFSELPISAIEDNTDLIEIKDERMLARINESMPELGSNTTVEF